MSSSVGWRLDFAEPLQPLVDGQRAGPAVTTIRCDHCLNQRVHEVLWHVTSDETGQSLTVGPECCPLACEGWTPSANELRKAERQLEQATLREQRLAIDFEARELATRILAAQLTTLTIFEQAKDLVPRDRCETWLRAWLQDVVYLVDGGAASNETRAEVRRRATHRLERELRARCLAS